MVQRQEQPWWAVIVLLAVFFPFGVIVLTLKALRKTWARRKNGRMLCILGAISVCMGALGGALAVLSGADNPQIAAAIFGLPAAVLWMTYVISNTVLIIAGRGYATEMPYVIQLAMLCLSVHSLCLLLTVSGQRASAKAESNLEENALKDTGNA